MHAYRSWMTDSWMVLIMGRSGRDLPNREESTAGPLKSLFAAGVTPVSLITCAPMTPSLALFTGLKSTSSLKAAIATRSVPLTVVSVVGVPED